MRNIVGSTRRGAANNRIWPRGPGLPRLLFAEQHLHRSGIHTEQTQGKGQEGCHCRLWWVRIFEIFSAPLKMVFLNVLKTFWSDVHHGNGTEETVRWLWPSLEASSVSRDGRLSDTMQCNYLATFRWPMKCVSARCFHRATSLGLMAMMQRTYCLCPCTAMDLARAA